MQDHHGHGHDEHGHDHEHASGPLAVLRHFFAPHSHDAADSVDAALESSADGIRAVKASLVVLLVTALAQAVLVVLTGSVALLGRHHPQLLRRARRRCRCGSRSRSAGALPNRAYTYGYRRAEDLAGIFIVVMIVASAVVAGYESLTRLLDPHPVGHPWVVAAAGVIGFAGNESWPGTASGSGAGSAPPRWWRTASTRAPTASPRWRSWLGAAGVLLGFPLADP